MRHPVNTLTPLPQKASHGRMASSASKRPGLSSGMEFMDGDWILVSGYSMLDERQVAGCGRPLQRKRSFASAPTTLSARTSKDAAAFWRPRDGFSHRPARRGRYPPASFWPCAAVSLCRFPTLRPPSAFRPPDAVFRPRASLPHQADKPPSMTISVPVT